NFAFMKFVDFDFSAVDSLRKDVSGVLAYDSQMRNVESAKKNAKIAGVNKLITFSKMDAEWLDTKLDKKSVDKIVTNLPRIGKESIKFISKLYKEFFYQAEFILKDDGLIVCITNNTEVLKKYADEYKFKVKSENEILSGQLKIVVLGK
ncbi:Rossmann-like fold-containing protein, partial [Nanoarchaeota archaeon]